MAKEWILLFSEAWMFWFMRFVLGSCTQEIAPIFFQWVVAYWCASKRQWSNSALSPPPVKCTQLTSFLLSFQTLCLIWFGLGCHNIDSCEIVSRLISNMTSRFSALIHFPKGFFQSIWWSRLSPLVLMVCPRLRHIPRTSNPSLSGDTCRSPRPTLTIQTTFLYSTTWNIHCPSFTNVIYCPGIVCFTLVTHWSQSSHA